MGPFKSVWLIDHWASVMDSHYFCCKQTWHAVVFLTQHNDYLPNTHKCYLMIVHPYDVGPVVKQCVQQLGYMQQ